MYLDYNATTPIDPAVTAEILPFLTAHFGNASSSHSYGQGAAAGMALGRRRLAALLGCQPEQLVYTAGGSESDNLALKGIVFAAVAAGRGPGHVITTQVEHPAVLAACRWLESLGCAVTYLPVDGFGLVDPDAVRAALRPDTVLVSVMHANNETGALQPVAAIGRLCREAGVLCHCDAAQSVGKTHVHVDSLQVDLLTVVGHKMYAPKGVGALYVRPGVHLLPLVHGGGQEHGLRAGTENIPYMAGLGKAAELCQDALAAGEEARLAGLRDRLHLALDAAIPGLVLNGPSGPGRLPNTLNVSFPGVFGADLLAATPEVAASTGAACHAGDVRPSATLLAMGITAARAAGAARLSLGRWSNEAEIDLAADLLARRWATLRRTGQA